MEKRKKALEMASRRRKRREWRHSSGTPTTCFQVQEERNERTKAGVDNGQRRLQSNLKQWIVLYISEFGRHSPASLHRQRVLVSQGSKFCGIYASVFSRVWGSLFRFGSFGMCTHRKTKTYAPLVIFFVK